MIPDLHARLSSTEELLTSRRALYAMALEFLLPAGDPGDSGLALGPGMLDSPLLRFAVGRGLRTGHPLAPDLMDGVRELADRHATFLDSPVQAIPVLSHPSAIDVFTTALQIVDDGQGTASFRTALDERHSADVRRLQDGVDLARQLIPELVADLLPHVALVGFLDHPACSVRSASLREYPGLILLSSPSSPIEAAEMIVHESAHQKLFDLGVVHDLLRPESIECEAFMPPWRNAGTRWPIVQTLAAFHAYACLAHLASKAGGLAQPDMLTERSLLSVAHQRATETGRWLIGRARFLGRDARALVSGIMDENPPLACAADDAPRPTFRAVRVTVDPGLRIQLDAAPDHVLVGRATPPHEFFFLDQDSGLILSLLRKHQVAETVATFAERRKIHPSDAESLISALLPQLAELSLISVGGR